jgi:hypothetical protein
MQAHHEQLLLFLSSAQECGCRLLMLRLLT